MSQNRASRAPRALRVMSVLLAGAVAIQVSLVSAQTPGVAAPDPATAAPSTPSIFQPRFDEAVTLYREKRYHKASQALYDLLVLPMPAAMASEVRFLLGQCLEVIHLPVLASVQYRDVIRMGPVGGEAYPRALAAWTAMSIRLDDTRELRDRLNRLPVARDPQGVAGLRYLRGVARYEAGQIEPALATLSEAAGGDTLVARQARYIQALAHERSGDREAAFAALEPLTSGRPTGVSGELNASEEVIAARLQELAVVGQARIRYAQGRLEEARSLYRRLSPASAYQPRARYEEAWIGFWEDRPLEAINLLAPLTLGKGGPGFVAEAELLAAMLYIRTNQYDLADGVLVDHLDRLYPLRVALRDLTRPSEGREARLELVAKLLGARAVVIPPVAEAGASPAEASGAASAVVEAAPGAQPAGPEVQALRPAIEELRRDRDLAMSLARASRSAAEAQSFNRQPQWWRRSALGLAAMPTLSREELAGLDAAGARLETLLLSYRVWLSEVNVLALALRREVTLQRLARAEKRKDPDPYTGEPLPPLDFIRPQ